MDKRELFLQFVVFGLIGLCAYTYLANKDTIQLKCVISTVDGNKYCVRDRKEVASAADLLARVTNKCKKLVEYVFKRFKPGRF